MQITRRNFLMCGTAGAVDVLGMLNVPEVDGRICIIGLGGAGMLHLNAISKVRGLKVVGIVDPNPERTKCFGEATEVGSSTTFLSFSDVGSALEGCQPDIVVIASPDAFHDEHLSAALQAGCHAVVEAYPASSPAGLHSWSVAFKARGLSLQIAAPWRLDSSYKGFREQLASLSTRGVARARVCCTVPQLPGDRSLLEGAGPISSCVFPFLDILLSGERFRESCSFFAVASQERRNGALKAPRHFIATAKIRDDFDLAIEYREAGFLPGFASAEIVFEDGTPSLEWSPPFAEHGYVGAELLPEWWTGFAKSLQGWKLQTASPESFQRTVTVSHALLAAYHCKGTLQCSREDLKRVGKQTFWAPGVLSVPNAA